MKEYSAKTVDDCLAAAAKELGIEADSLVYTVKEEKKGLFKKSATIDVYDQSDAVSYGETYLVSALKALGIEATVTSTIEEDIIKMTVNSERNPVLIGKNGHTLQALNELVKLAVSNKFRHRYRILLDVGGYKEDKYSRIAYIAKKNAAQVLKTHIDVHLEPMTPDERRVVHNTLSGMRFDYSPYTKIVGNLPYYITSGIVEKILLGASKASRVVLMVQKEAADRLLAKVGSKDYSPLSLYLNYVASVKRAFNVSRNAFVPAPHIESTVLIIDLLPDKHDDESASMYALAEKLFLYRRKTIYNNLKTYLGDDQKAAAILASAHLAPTLRPEELLAENYIDLVRLLKH